MQKGGGERVEIGGGRVVKKKKKKKKRRGRREERTKEKNSVSSRGRGAKRKPNLKKRFAILKVSNIKILKNK